MKSLLTKTLAFTRVLTAFSSTALVGAVLAPTSAWAQNLDLGILAAFDYSGKEHLTGNAKCNLSVSAPAKDFSGRWYQDFRVWVDGRAELNFTLRLRGGDRIRSPEKVIDSHSVQYGILLDTFKLELIDDGNDGTLISEFHLVDTHGLTGSQPTLIQCTHVIRTPR